LGVVASNVNDLSSQLRAAEHSPIAKSEWQGKPSIGFVFSGQGAQYAQMGRQLLTYPTFLRSMEKARQKLIHLGCTWDLLVELCRCDGESRINEPAISQPSCTAIQLALVDLLVEFGVFPCAVVGHSSGEIAAAYAIGVISFDNAMAASYFRGKVTSDLLADDSHSPGAMLAVGASPDAVVEHIQKIESEHSRMRVACFNSPRSVTVSGDATAIDALKVGLDANGTFNRKLKTNGAAYHSHHMEAVREEYAASLRGLGHTQRSKEPHGRFFSTVSGKEIDPSEICADYWTRNLLSPVLFTQAFSKMGEGKYGDRHLDAVLEIGPHSQLAGPVKQILNESPKTRGRPRYISSLTRGKDAELSLLECLAQLHIHGASLPLHQLNRYDPRHPPKRLVDLPPYPFDYARTFWHDSRVSKNYTHRKYLPHELLGTLSPEANRLEPQWRHFLSIKKSPWLRSHVVQGQIVFPAAGYLTMAMQAVHQHMKTTSPSTRIGSFALRNISISKALLLSEGTPELEVCLSLRPQPRSARESSTWNEFRIFSATPDDKWTEHCRGLIQSVAEAEEVDGAGLICGLLKQGSAQCSRPVKPERFYHLSRQIGLHWQHPFNNISGLRTGVGACVTTASSPDGAAPGGVGDVLHPALLDSCLFQGHCASLMLERDLESPAVPTFIRDMRVSNKPVPPGKTLHATSVGSPQDQYTYDVAVQNESNTNQPLLVVAHGVTLAKLPGGSAGQQNEDICYSVNWTPYVDAWKAEDRNKFCNRMPSPEPNLQRSRFLLSLSAHYTRQAVAQVQQGEVLDAYRELFSKLQTSAESSDNNSPMPEATPGLDAEVFSEALLKVGPHLPSILTGKVNALSLMTADDFVRVYDSNHSRQCISQISEYCYALGKQTPRLSVLATGAGTAPATAPVVRALNGRDGRYLSKLEVTDMSDGQFELIKEDLGSLADVVELRALDAACDVTQQGFDIATYDLIVATYPVHTVRQLDLVLSNLRQMLKPGGKLVILVVTKGTPHYEFLFDIFEGQSATTGEVATGTHRLSPVLERPAWISKMKDAGLQNPEFCFEDCPEINGGTLSVFMGTGPWDVGPAAQLPLHLVTTDCSLVEMSAVEARIGQIRDCLPDAHISVQGLSTTSTGDNMVILLPEVARYMCGNRDESCWQRFKNLLLNARAVLLVSSSSSSNGPDRHNEPCGAIWLGLARCLRLEHPHIRFVAIDFSSGDIFHKLAAQLPVLLHRTPTFCLNRPGNETENEFKEMEGQLYISRINAHRENSDYIHSMHRQSLPTLTPFFGGNRLLTAELGTSGLLETFRWKDDDKAPVLGADDVRLELRAASINFKDVLVAAGQLPGITEMRNDCSGVVVEVGANMQQRFKPGDRVMALYSRPYTNYPVVHGDCCHVMPNNLSFEEGASVPIVWGTVYHSLVDMGRLTKGNKLLIHSAAGAVGQAAIMLAQHVGAEVFATVSSQCKRDLLHDQFSIPYDHIFSSRTTAFAAGIRELTGGYGVDVVLNSLSGEMFRHSCNLVAPFGRFVEIGRKELMDDALMPMAFLLKNISFVYVDMSLIIDVKKPLARRILNDVGHFLATGSIRPVSITTMPISEIEAAFRHIQAGKHTGKIVLKVEDNQEVKVSWLGAFIDPPLPAISTDMIIGSPTDARARKVQDRCHLFSRRGLRWHWARRD
jgi:emericellamide synthase (highly reducing iterative type I polyketide synthase)